MQGKLFIVIALAALGSTPVAAGDTVRRQTCQKTEQPQQAKQRQQQTQQQQSRAKPQGCPVPRSIPSVFDPTPTYLL